MIEHLFEPEILKFRVLIDCSILLVDLSQEYRFNWSQVSFNVFL